MNQKDNWINMFRELWPKIKRNDFQRRTALAIISGIVERSDKSSLWRAEEWLSRMQNYITEAKEIPLESIEIEAHQLDLGLHLFDPERDPEKITAYFGVVQSIREGIADISFYVRETTENPEDPILESIEVLEAYLPIAYTRPGVWVAWVERQYKFGMSKGRFEPASSLPK